MSRRDDLLARVDPDLLDLLPGYIENRARDVVTCREHLSHGRFEAIRVVAHGMAGSGGSYGLDEITRIGRTLERAAQAADAASCERGIAELSEEVLRLQAVFDS